MKKPASIKAAGYFLLFLAAFPLLFMMVLQGRQQIVQYKMKERLRHQELHTIVVNMAEVRWIKKDKEIWVGDRMFDIKSIRTEAGRYIFTGLFDTEETGLLHLMERGRRQETDNNKLLFQLFSLLQSPCITAQPAAAMATAVNPIQFPPANSPLCNHPAEILTPPPRV